MAITYKDAGVNIEEDIDQLNLLRNMQRGL